MWPLEGSRGLREEDGYVSWVRVCRDSNATHPLKTRRARASSVTIWELGFGEGEGEGVGVGHVGGVENEVKVKSGAK